MTDTQREVRSLVAAYIRANADNDRGFAKFALADNLEEEGHSREAGLVRVAKPKFGDIMVALHAGGGTKLTRSVLGTVTKLTNRLHRVRSLASFSPEGAADSTGVWHAYPWEEAGRPRKNPQMGHYTSRAHCRRLVERGLLGYRVPADVD